MFEFFVALRFNAKLLTVQQTIQDTDDLWVLVSPWTMACLSVIRDSHLETIEGIIDREPGSVFVLTGDRNGLRTAELQLQLELDQLAR